ncbi:cell division protein ZapD [Thalassotalea sp. M1531]|uniref:Cell division protein ZapD n=1 Tax=Thalassotalea algicola TaxID=2716224 RepID=A0A7Y0Q7M4_9GAMM|nr:cell division protein ZapD [Thalassotalea algicola]NMP32057.1 cell division protein ZapD [Thalassotalea algicola]
MASVLYEHPLNERIRNYLKLEQLFAQAKNCLPEQIATNYQVFFNALFAIFDTLDRNDIRGELIKDLEKLEQHLVIWSKSPEINSPVLEENLQQVVALICTLRGNLPPWHVLKDDKLLASIKQRFAIQGGSSIFDLPQLQFWLSRPIDRISTDISLWLSKLAELEQAIGLIMKFLRQRSGYDTINTESGFYQDNGEGLLLLRIKVDERSQHYPTVSGNKFRYSIRFMLPCDKTGRKYSSQPTTFELARC